MEAWLRVSWSCGAPRAQEEAIHLKQKTPAFQNPCAVDKIGSQHETIYVQAMW